MKILVPIDGSEFSKHSIEFVTSRATLLGHNPEIELLSVQAPVPARASKLIGNGSLSGYYDEEANVILEPAIEALKAAGVKATARYAVGEAAPTIAKVAEESGADLIIMGSHGRSALKGLLLGSVTNSVLALCDKPVLILRNKPAPTNDSLKVGVAIDGSKYGEAAVEHILKNHDIFGDHPTFYLMNVVSDYAGVVMPDMAGMALPTMNESEVRAMQQESFDEAVGMCFREEMHPSAFIFLHQTFIIRNEQNSDNTLSCSARADRHGHPRLRSIQSRRPRFDRYAYCRDQRHTSVGNSGKLTPTDV